MACERHQMAALIQVDPTKAKKQIVDAYVKAKCHFGEAAKALGCHQHTLGRWAEALGIQEQLKKIAERALKEGWHHGRRGGAGFFRNPEERNRRFSESMKRRRAATGS